MDIQKISANTPTFDNIETAIRTLYGQMSADEFAELGDRLSEFLSGNATFSSDRTTATA